MYSEIVLKIQIIEELTNQFIVRSVHAVGTVGMTPLWQNDRGLRLLHQSLLRVYICKGFHMFSPKNTTFQLTDIFKNLLQGYQ